MEKLPQLFENNRRWAARMTAEDSQFFARLAEQQSPAYLWIGCSDSRVPANEIVGLLPGELFVHRNIANIVSQTDTNALSVLQFAVETLGVQHVIVCGHYGCGGVQAALNNNAQGLVYQWLAPIRDTASRRMQELNALPTDQRVDRLCELNVMAQALAVAQTDTVRATWARRQPLVIHGWIYRITDGLLKDLGICLTSTDDLTALLR